MLVWSKGLSVILNIINPFPTVHNNCFLSLLLMYFVGIYCKQNGTRSDSECPFPIKMGILANSEDPDQITHNVVFHLGLHCFQTQNNLQRKKYNHFCKYGLIYTMDYPELTVSTPLVQKGLMNNNSVNKPKHNENLAATCDFQQCGILT